MGAGKGSVEEMAVIWKTKGKGQRITKLRCIRKRNGSVLGWDRIVLIWIFTGENVFL